MGKIKRGSASKRREEVRIAPVADGRRVCLRLWLPRRGEPSLVGLPRPRAPRGMTVGEAFGNGAFFGWLLVVLYFQLRLR